MRRVVIGTGSQEVSETKVLQETIIYVKRNNKLQGIIANNRMMGWYLKSSAIECQGIPAVTRLDLIKKLLADGYELFTE